MVGLLAYMFLRDVYIGVARFEGAIHTWVPYVTVICKSQAYALNTGLRYHSEQIQMHTGSGRGTHVLAADEVCMYCRMGSPCVCGAFERCRKGSMLGWSTRPAVRRVCGSGCKCGSRSPCCRPKCCCVRRTRCSRVG